MKKLQIANSNPQQFILCYIKNNIKLLIELQKIMISYLLIKLQNILLTIIVILHIIAQLSKCLINKIISYSKYNQMVIGVFKVGIGKIR